MFDQLKSVGVRAGAALAGLSVLAVTVAQATVTDLSALTTGAQAEAANGVTAALPVAGFVIGVGIAIALFRKFAK